MSRVTARPSSPGFLLGNKRVARPDHFCEISRLLQPSRREIGLAAIALYPTVSLVSCAEAAEKEERQQKADCRKFPCLHWILLSACKFRILFLYRITLSAARRRDRVPFWTPRMVHKRLAAYFRRRQSPDYFVGSGENIRRDRRRPICFAAFRLIMNSNFVRLPLHQADPRASRP